MGRNVYEPAGAKKKAKKSRGVVDEVRKLVSRHAYGLFKEYVCELMNVSCDLTVQTTPPMRRKTKAVASNNVRLPTSEYAWLLDLHTAHC